MSIVTQIERLQQAKSDIINAIEAKGVQVPLSSTMDDMAELILKIGEEAGDQGPIYTSYIIDQTPITKDGVVTGTKLPEDVIIGQAAKDNDTTAEVNGETVYKNVIRRIRDNSHCYISRIENGSGVGYQNLWQLDDNDHYYLKDGVTKTSTIYNMATDDIVMKLPDFWWKIEQLDQDGYRLKVSFCMSEADVDNTWNFWNGKTCIGVYKACNQSGNLTTTDNDFDNYFYSQPSREQIYSSIENIKVSAHNSEFGGQPIDYECRQVMALLGYGWYSTTAIYDIIQGTPYDHFGEISESTTTGYTESFGMEDTYESFIVRGETGYYSVVSYYNKFWGLENWVGSQELLPYTTITTTQENSVVTLNYQISRYENDSDQVSTEFTFDYKDYINTNTGSPITYFIPTEGIMAVVKLIDNKYLIPFLGTETGNRGFACYNSIYTNSNNATACAKTGDMLGFNFYNSGSFSTRLMIRPKEDVVITLMN